MQNTCLLYIVSQVLKILLIKLKEVYDATSPFVCYCFTLDFICISRYDFLQVFRTSSTIIRKKFFVRNSTFLMDSRKPLLLLNHQNPPSVTSFREIRLLNLDNSTPKLDITTFFSFLLMFKMDLMLFTVTAPFLVSNQWYQ